jgi:hypothetical protein
VKVNEALVGLIHTLYLLIPSLLHILLGVDLAQALWSLLLPHGFSGGALAHVPLRDNDNDSSMDGGEGFKEEYIEWWFEFLAQKGYKGVSKDTWAMVRFLSFFYSTSIGLVVFLFAAAPHIRFIMPNDLALSFYSFLTSSSRLTPISRPTTRMVCDTPNISLPFL